MPQSQDALERAEFLRLLLLGFPKTGKTTTAILTSPGPIYVINCDQESSLLPARRLGAKFEWDYVRKLADMENAIRCAQMGVQKGKYKTVILDTLTSFARRAREEFEVLSKSAAGEPDGRKYWDWLSKRLLNTCDRLLDLHCHVIVIAHYTEVSKEIDGQLQKTGEGIVPLIQGSARNQISGMFDDVVFFQKNQGKREFLLKDGGKFGPGGRSQDTVDVIEADITELWKLFREAAEPAPAKPTKLAKK